MTNFGERRVKPVISQPIEQHATQIPFSSITLSEKVRSPGAAKDGIGP